MAEPGSKGPGAPSYAWTEEIEDEILERIADGEAIRTICGPERDAHLPSWPTFRRRLIESPGFATQYAHAREVQADGEFDETKTIADQSKPDTVAVDKLRIDVRKWRAGKLRPKVYGEKLNLEGSGETGEIVFRTVYEQR